MTFGDSMSWPRKQKAPAGAFKHKLVLDGYHFCEVEQHLFVLHGIVWYGMVVTGWSKWIQGVMCFPFWSLVYNPDKIIGEKHKKDKKTFALKHYLYNPYRMIGERIKRLNSKKHQLVLWSTSSCFFFTSKVPGKGLVVPI